MRQTRSRQASLPLRRIGRDIGLPSGQVHAIAQGSDGAIWLAGPSGLAMFDGVRVRSFGRSDGLSTQGLRSLAFTAQGMYIGSDVGVDVRGHDGVISPLCRQWDHGFVESIAVEASGDVWFASARGLARLRAGGEIERMEDPRITGTFVRAVMCDDRSRAHVIVGGDVIVEDPEWTDLRLERDGPVTAMCTRGSIRFFAVGNTVIELAASGEELSRAELGSGGEIECLLATSNELWVATRRSLFCCVRNGDSWRVANQALDDVQINALYEDASGNVWIASDSSGAFLVSALREAIAVRNPVRHGAVFSIAHDKDGVLVGGDGQSWLDDGAGLQPIAGLDGQRVWDLRRDQQGRLWAATQDGLYGCDELGNWSPKHRGLAVLDAPNRCLFPLSDRLLVGTVTGLAAIDSAGSARVLFDGEPGYVYTLASRGDDVFLGTVGSGMWRTDGDAALTRFAGDAIGNDSNVYAIAVRSDGILAVSFDDAIAICSPATSSEPAVSKIVHRSSAPVAGWSLQWGRGDSLWVGGGNGLYLLDVATGEVTVTIRALLGANGWEFTTSRSLYREPSGQLRCGVSGGAVSIDPDKLADILAPPETRLAGIKWHGLEIEDGWRTVEIDAGTWSAEVMLSAPWFFDAELRFQYRIIGLENEWLEAPPDAIIRLTALPPGRYEVQARASSPATGPGPISRMLALEVNAPWWAPAWIDGPVRLARKVSGALRGKTRNRDLLRENSELEREVRMRTHELEKLNARLERANDELSQAAVTDPLTGVFNRRWLDVKLPQELERGARTSAPLSLLMIDVDHFKLYNDSFGHVAGDRCLATIAAKIVSQLRSSMDTVARYGGEEFAVLLPSCNADGGERLAERIRDAVSQLKIEHRVGDGFVSVSIGGATFEGTEGQRSPALLAEGLVCAADVALYEAKDGGRNRVRWGLLGATADKLATVPHT